MMRSKFDAQLALLNTELIEMGALCESAISNAATALLQGDTELAERANEIEREIDEKERGIESLCMKLLLQQQPVARDLRQISSALKMITDMERIGDQTRDIAEIISMANIRVSSEATYIAQMAKATTKMVTDSVDAFVRQDVALARQVRKDDDVVDDLFNKIKAALIVSIGESDEHAEHAIDLLMIAKYFERIGDHAENVAEWVIFSITGVREGGGL